MSEIIYLASPYTSDDAAVMEWRFQQVSRCAAKLAREGFPIFCPISHSHPWVPYGVPHDWEFWASLDRHFLEVSREIWVLCLPGWEDSTGVQAEVKMMLAINRPVRYLEWDDDGTQPQ